MPGVWKRWMVLSLAGWFALTSRAALDAVECQKIAAQFGAGEGGARLHYAPDREVAVRHLALDVTPDFSHRTVTGAATWRFQPNVEPVREIRLDAVDLAVDSVTASEPVEAWQVSADQIVITFAAVLPADHETWVRVAYHAQPEQGLYFRTPETGFRPGDTHCFSQGEEIEARHWYPSFDAPNEKFTSEVTCHVPVGMTAVSNGRLVDCVTNAATGRVAFHWSQEQPHANYLVSLVAGLFRELDARHGNVPLAFLTPASEFAEAANSFRNTDDVMGFFEDEIGVPFPWAKYDQTCVNDFVAGGMENTSATTLTDATLFRAETENLRDSASLVAHEMAHQWFGDLVTCKDWSHIWLNEGFATYYQIRYTGHKDGHDAMLYDLHQAARGILGVANDVHPIVRRDYQSPSEMFNYLAYPKGAWVLHMLRSQLGDDLYRRCIRTYLERHRYGNVTTEDLRAVIEELTGRSFDRFFDQWVYHPHYPELAGEYSWDQRTKLAKITVRQQQSLGSNVLLFEFPLTLRFKGKFGLVEETVQVKEVAQQFYFPLASAPEVVRLDPAYTLLAKTDFPLPAPMLYAQLGDATDVMGRILAVEELTHRADAETVAHLKNALNHDGFFGVRIEAAEALGSIHTDEALAALIDSVAQPDARVRRAVVTAVDGFYRESAWVFLQHIAETEPNPDIVATALKGLGLCDRPEVHALLVKELNQASYRDNVAAAAISGLRKLGRAADVPAVLAVMPRLEGSMSAREFGPVLDDVAAYGSLLEDKSAVREYLVARLQDPRQAVRLRVMAGLGTLGDLRAVPALQTFTGAVKDSPERTAAEAAVTALAGRREPALELQTLRAEMNALQQTNRQFGRDLDDLRSRLDAVSAAAKPRKSR